MTRRAASSGGAAVAVERPLGRGAPLREEVKARAVARRDGGEARVGADHLRGVLRQAMALDAHVAQQVRVRLAERLDRARIGDPADERLPQLLDDPPSRRATREPQVNQGPDPFHTHGVCTLLSNVSRGRRIPPDTLHVVRDIGDSRGANTMILLEDFKLHFGVSG